MENFKKPETFLLGIVLLLGVLIAYKTIPTKVDPTIKITIYPQNKPIFSIDDQKTQKNAKTFFADSIEFGGASFGHPKLGGLGFDFNFFADLNSKIEAAKGGEYVFSIYSDDGFRLFVDEKPICEFKTDRPMTKTQCPVFLEKGEHEIRLIYFQGGGNMGLKGFYREKENKKEKLIGKSDKNIKFIGLK